MNKKNLSVSLLSPAKIAMALLLSTLSSHAWTMPIPVVNSNFDYTRTSDSAVNPLNSFTIGFGAGVPLIGFAPPSTGTADALGWELDPLGGAGIGGMATLDASSWGTSAPSGGTGFLNVRSTDGGTSAQSAFMRQEIATALNPNTAYTLTVDLFARSSGAAFPDELFVQLVTLSGGVYSNLGGTLNIDPFAGGASTATLTVTTDSTVTADSDLWIRLGAQTNSTDLQQVNFDNVALDAVASTIPVPEPLTLALLGIGLTGIGLSRRRRAA